MRVLLLFLAVGAVAAQSRHAVSVIDAMILDGRAGNTNSDVTRILGATDGKSVSLGGGDGGYIVVRLGEAAVDGPGADLEVHEVGSIGGGVDETYRVSVSDDSLAFVVLGTGTAITSFDFANVGVDNVTHVRIDDMSFLTLDTNTPGSDIDSVSVLHTSAGGAASEVTGLQASLVCGGVRVRWDKLSDPAVVGYGVRVSRDGVAFPSAFSYTTSAFESGLLLPSLSISGSVWISVAVLRSDGTQGIQAITKVGMVHHAIPVFTGVVHLGDAVVSDWDVPQPTAMASQTFTVTALPRLAEISFDVWNVHNANKIIVNGILVGTTPTHTPSSWKAVSVSFDPAVLVTGVNTVDLVAVNSQGGVTGNLDDFQLRNILIKGWVEE